MGIIELGFSVFLVQCSKNGIYLKVREIKNPNMRQDLIFKTQQEANYSLKTNNDFWKKIYSL